MTEKIFVNLEPKIKLDVSKSIAVILELITKLYNKINNEKLIQEDINEILSNIDKSLNILLNMLNYNEDHNNNLFNNINEYYKKELLELENKIKNLNRYSGFKEHTEILNNKITNFWNRAGFNFVKDFKISRNGYIHIDLRFHCDSPSVYKYDKPVTNKRLVIENIEKLKNDGFIFCDNNKNQLLDCDNNKSLITNILKKYIPSVKINSWKSSATLIEDQQTISELIITIKDYNDIVNFKMLCYTDWYKEKYNDEWTEEHAVFHSDMIEFEEWCEKNNFMPIWNG